MTQPPNPIWLEGAGDIRLPLTVSAGAIDRIDKPCEVMLDIAGLLEKEGMRDRYLANNLHMVEVDAAGRILAQAMPFQFDMMNDADPVSTPAGNLVWLMQGVTPAGTSRHYHVYLDAAPAVKTDDAGKPAILVTDGVEDEQQDCFQIDTWNATYYYQKVAAGFSSLLDLDGNDWIGYRPGGGSAGEYRGIPNVAPIGFHPGYDNSNSRLVSSGPVKVTLYSETNDQQAACTWEIYPTFATFTLLRKGPEPYWLLYEGTPGGSFDPENDYIVHADGRKRPASESWDEVLPDPAWLYFGSGKTPRVLYFIQHQNDDLIDSYWPMEGNMTVFGFGRTSERGKRHSWHMQAVPAAFTIGFAENGAYDQASKVVESALQPITIQVGQMETR